jgi:hypothetical protein
MWNKQILYGEAEEAICFLAHENIHCCVIIFRSLPGQQV